MARRRDAQPLYRLQHGHEAPRGHCRECGTRVRPPRRSWCSARCVVNYKVRADPNFLRREVFLRDNGVCSTCRLDCRQVDLVRGRAHHEALRAWWEEHGVDLDMAGKPDPARAKDPEWRESLRRHVERALAPYGLERYWTRRTFWDAHHVVPVAEGGALLGLKNVVTLCVKCHAHETAEQRGRGGE